MDELVAGIIAVVGGIILLLFRKPIARYTTLGQNKVWSGYNFGEKEILATEKYWVPAVAVCWMIFGVGLVVHGLVTGT